jgi:eukaryotic-like serine/threonine-protein kinase
LLMTPLRQLKAALNDAGRGNLDFRISHQRRDEFADLFEAFNALAAAMQKRLEAGGVAAPANLDATAILAPPANTSEPTPEQTQVRQW